MRLELQDETEEYVCNEAANQRPDNMEGTMDSMRRHSSEVKTCPGKANPALRAIRNDPMNEDPLREASETSFSAVEI